MDARLVAWARAVKARRSRTAPQHAALPVLWLFTDWQRLPDPLPAIAALPSGLSGVVFRHDGMPGRRLLAVKVARACRSRRIALCVAGDWRLAAWLGAGVHLRAGVPGRPSVRCHQIVTAAAHDRQEVFRAASLGASLVFLSPVFATASHPATPPLGVLKWRAASMGCAVPVLALGGITGPSAKALPRRACAGAGAITALA